MRHLWRQIFPPLLVFAFIAIGLQLAIKWLHIPPYELPLPTAVGRALIDDRSELASALWTTTQASLIGLGGSIVVGIFTAILLSSSHWIRRAFYPYTLFFQTVPIVAIAPLLVIWVDPGLASVFDFGVHLLGVSGDC